MIVWSPIKYNLEVCDQYIVDNEFVGEIRSYRILNQMKRQTVHLAKAATFTVFISDVVSCQDKRRVRNFKLIASEV